MLLFMESIRIGICQRQDDDDTLLLQTKMFNEPLSVRGDEPPVGSSGSTALIAIPEGAEAEPTSEEESDAEAEEFEGTATEVFQMLDFNEDGVLDRFEAELGGFPITHNADELHQASSLIWMVHDGFAFIDSDNSSNITMDEFIGWTAISEEALISYKDLLIQLSKLRSTAGGPEDAALLQRRHAKKMHARLLAMSKSVLHRRQQRLQQEPGTNAQPEPALMQERQTPPPPQPAPGTPLEVRPQPELALEEGGRQTPPPPRPAPGAPLEEMPRLPEPRPALVQTALMQRQAATHANKLSESTVEELSELGLDQALSGKGTTWWWPPSYFPRDDDWGIDGEHYPRSQCWHHHYRNQIMSGMPICGAHNSHAFGYGGHAVCAHDTQIFDVAEQIRRGVRFMDVDFDWNDNRFEHGNWGYGTAETFFDRVTSGADSCSNDIYWVNLNDKEGGTRGDVMKKFYDVARVRWRHGEVHWHNACTGGLSGTSLPASWWNQPYGRYAGSLIISSKNCAGNNPIFTWGKSWWKDSDNFPHNYCNDADIRNTNNFVVSDGYKDSMCESRILSPTAVQKPGHAWERCRKTGAPTVFSQDAVEYVDASNECCETCIMTLKAHQRKPYQPDNPRVYVHSSCHSWLNGFYQQNGANCHGRKTYERVGNNGIRLWWMHLGFWMMGPSGSHCHNSGWFWKWWNVNNPWDTNTAYWDNCHSMTLVELAMQVTNTGSQTGRSGVYVAKQHCDGKPHYFCVEGCAWSNQQMWSHGGVWHVGEAGCGSNNAGLYAAQNVYRPSDLTIPWYQWNNGWGYSTPGTTVRVAYV